MAKLQMEDNPTPSLREFPPQASTVKEKSMQLPESEWIKIPKGGIHEPWPEEIFGQAPATAIREGRAFGLKSGDGFKIIVTYQQNRDGREVSQIIAPDPSKVGTPEIWDQVETLVFQPMAPKKLRDLLEANRADAAVRKFKDTGEINDDLLKGFDQTGRWRGLRHFDQKALAGVSLTRDQIQTTSSDGKHILLTGFRETDKASELPWHEIRGPAVLFRPDANFPNLIRCGDIRCGFPCATLTAPLLEEANNLEAHTAKMSFPNLLRTISLKTPEDAHTPNLERCVELLRAKTVVAPKLKHAGDIHTRKARPLILPELASLTGNVDSPHSTQVDLPNLEESTGWIRTAAAALSAPKLKLVQGILAETVNLPELEEIPEGMLVSGNLILPKLKTAGQIQAGKASRVILPQATQIEKLDIPLCEEFEASELQQCQDLTTPLVKNIRLPKLTTAGWLRMEAAEKVELPNLTMATCLELDNALQVKLPRLMAVAAPINFRQDADVEMPLATDWHRLTKIVKAGDKAALKQAVTQKGATRILADVLKLNGGLEEVKDIPEWMTASQNAILTLLELGADPNGFVTEYRVEKRAIFEMKVTPLLIAAVCTREIAPLLKHGGNPDLESCIGSWFKGKKFSLVSLAMEMEAAWLLKAINHHRRIPPAAAKEMADEMERRITTGSFSQIERRGDDIGDLAINFNRVRIPDTGPAEKCRDLLLQIQKAGIARKSLQTPDIEL